MLKLSLMLICLLMGDPVLAQGPKTTLPGPVQSPKTTLAGSAQRSKTTYVSPVHFVPNPLPFKPGDSVSVKIDFTADKTFADFNGIGTFDPDSPDGTSELSYDQSLELRIYALNASSEEPKKGTPYLVARGSNYRKVPRESEKLRVA